MPTETLSPPSRAAAVLLVGVLLAAGAAGALAPVHPALAFIVAVVPLGLAAGYAVVVWGAWRITG